MINLKIILTETEGKCLNFIVEIDAAPLYEFDNKMDEDNIIHVKVYTDNLREECHIKSGKSRILFMHENQEYNALMKHAQFFYTCACTMFKPISINLASLYFKKFEEIDIQKKFEIDSVIIEDQTNTPEIIPYIDKFMETQKHHFNIIIRTEQLPSDHIILPSE